MKTRKKIGTINWPNDFSKRKKRADQLFAIAEQRAKENLLSDREALRIHEEIGKCYDF
jgi:hypothetical protein